MVADPVADPTDPAAVPPVQPVTYRDAGVDIDAGNRLVELIRSAAASTRRRESRSDLGGFGAVFAPRLKGMKKPLLVSSTDGVGTKLKLAFLLDRHDTVGIDLVAMSVNDLLVQGAEPLFFLDYFATGKLRPETAATVISGIAEGCRQAGCQLSGGETAEMPGFYPPGEYDLAGFAVGLVDRSRLIDGRRIRPGDVMLGLPSSGPHSNGYSLIRRLVLGEGGPGLESPFGGRTLGEALLEPTRIYVKALRQTARKVTIKGVVHITGGGFWENLPRVLPPHVTAVLEKRRWFRPPVFDLLQRLGAVTEEEMLRTFNCGLGMVLFVAEKEADAAVRALRKAGEEAVVVGRVRKRRGDEGQVEILP
ncbi:MAG: phosphoribosylformylglycinamidine cyclo-ligase [Magnetococcales bacterium]|nr:phosphoribosylformylglycinamidine cyclo-ligase [Magnetococcales bacterium]